MRTQRMSLWRITYLLILGMSIPFVVLLLNLTLYHLAFIVAVAVITGVFIEVTGWSPVPSPAAQAPELQLINAVPAPLAPIAIRAVAEKGVCPLGFQKGSTWTIDGEGHLSPWLCRPAVESLSTLLQAHKSEREELTTSCRCPLGDRELIFAKA